MSFFARIPSFPLNRQDVRFSFGPSEPGWWALVGDCNGDGTEGIGLYKDGTFILRSLTAEGVEDNEFVFDPGDGRPVVGDWDGNGIDTVGVFVGNTFYLRNSNSPGPFDIEVATGWADAVPLVGDWNGNGQDGIGIHYQDTFYLGISAGLPDNAAPFHFGPAGWYPIIGDWNNNGRDTIGLFNNGLWRLRNSSSDGPVDHGFRYGNLEGGWQPLSFNSDIDVLNRFFAATVPEPRVPVIPGPDLPPADSDSAQQVEAGSDLDSSTLASEIVLQPTIMSTVTRGEQ